MRFALILASTLCLAPGAFAASPFTISGTKIAAIFSSDLWRKVFGPVQSITFKGHDQATKTSTYTVTTLEPARDGHGGVTSSSCSFDVAVTAQGDDLAPQWAVTGSDFSACPALSGR